MRIAIASQTYFPGSNGQAVFTIHLAEGLACLGHDVLVIAPSLQPRDTTEVVNRVCIRGARSIRLSPIHPNSYLTLLGPGQAGRIFDEFRPQILHIQDHYPLARSAVHAASKRGIPIVGTNHFLPENLLPYLPRYLPLSRQQRIALLWKTMLDVYNHTDAVITPTATAAQILQRQDIHPSVTPISCGVDEHRFFPDPLVDRGAIRCKYGLPADKAVFLYVGRLDREKRMDLLIQALHKLESCPAHLAIAGVGSQAEALSAQVRRLGLEDRVTLTGYIPPEDLPVLLNGVDIFCMPSPEELQSIASLEAMSTGRPILAANARALPELVGHEINGFLFKPGDVEDVARGMAWFLASRDRWTELGAASLERARRHSLTNTLRQYLTLYQGVIQARREPI